MLRLIDVAGLRSVGVRRHPRGPHRRHRPDCRSAAERFRGGTRVTFLCGGRALAGLSIAAGRGRRKRSRLVGSARRAAGRQSNGCRPRARILRKQIKDFQTSAAAHEADALAEPSEETGAGRLVVVIGVAGAGTRRAQVYCVAIVERSGHVAISVGGPRPPSAVSSRALPALRSIRRAVILKRVARAARG